MPIGEQLTTTTTTTQSDAYHNFVIHVRNAATRLNYVCKLIFEILPARGGKTIVITAYFLTMTTN
jgi:hypothetical protein